MTDKIPDNYFVTIDNHMMDYLEKEGNEALQEFLEINDAIKEKAFKIFNILTVGVGGGILLLVNNPQTAIWNIALIAFIFYWMALSIYIGVNCLRSYRRALAHNSPANLYNSEVKESNYNDREKLDYLRKANLASLEDKIDEARAINHKVGFHINNAITAMAASPLFVLLVFLISYFLFF